MEHCEAGNLYNNHFNDENIGFDIPQTEVLKIIIQIAAGLRAAHSRGIVHRDLKAGNVLLTKDGFIKICDFGQAKNLSAHIDGRTALTKEGIGTRGYKAPEILEQNEYGPPADIWSLGCIVHLLCTKTRWFEQRHDEILPKQYI